MEEQGKDDVCSQHGPLSHMHVRVHLVLYYAITLAVVIKPGINRFLRDDYTDVFLVLV